MASLMVESMTSSGNSSVSKSNDTAFGCAKDYLDNRYVYAVVSPRARGLSIGLNLNPDKFCNFDCDYCEVSRQANAPAIELNVEQLQQELEQTLHYVLAHRVREATELRAEVF